MASPASAQAAAARVARRGHSLARALAGVEPWLVVPVLLAGLAVPRLLGPALVAAGLFWAARRAALGRFTVRTPGDGLIAFLLLLTPVTLTVTAFPGITWLQVQWLLTGIALYYVIVNWVGALARERLFIRLVMGLSLLTAFAAPFAVTWVTDIKLTFIPEALYRALPRLAPVPIHPNVLAGALVLALPIPLGLLLFDRSGLTRRERAVAIAAVAGMAAILLLTKSRGAWLAAAGASIALLLLRWRRGWLLIPVAALAAGLILWRVGLDEIAAPLRAAGALIGMPGRVELWTRAVYLIQDFPFTGIGMGTFEPLTNAFYPYFLLGPHADAPHAHNLFLQVAVDLGIPGFAAWLGLLAASSFAGWRVMAAGRRSGDGWSAGLGAGLLAAQVALVVHGMFDAAVWGAHSGIVVWVLWGACMAAYNLRD